MSNQRTYTPLEDYGVTPEQIANLERLYAGTERFLGADDSFDMSKYSDAPSPSTTECSTVACMAGHGPKVGIVPYRTERWEGYVGRVFVLAWSPPWWWLFSDFWVPVDNTLGGARQRIRIALDRGIPSDWRAQMMDRAPLEYKES